MNNAPRICDYCNTNPAPARARDVHGKARCAACAVKLPSDPRPLDVPAPVHYPVINECAGDWAAL